MSNSNIYEGINNDKYGGMTMIGAIIKDAWIFGAIPESETCEGWDLARIQALYDKVNALRETYGYRFDELPDEIKERHERIHREATQRARALGWDPDHDLADEA